MKADEGGRRRRGWLVRATPVVALVLVAGAATAVVVHNTRRNAAASPTAFHASTTPRHPTTTPTTTTATPTPTPTPSPTPTTPANQALLQQAVSQVDGLHFRGVTIGIAVEDRASGQVLGGQAGATPFYAASVIKLFTVTYLLHQQEVGALKLGPGMQDEITRALELSDDNAMNDFWSTYGGVSLISKFIALYGLQNTIAPRDTAQWGETKFSPEDVLRVYDYALNKLWPADYTLIMNDLASAADRGADGFDQAFGLINPPRPANVKAKQGWMDILGDSMTLNSTGVLGPQNNFLIAIMTKQPVGIGWAAGRTHVNEAAAAVEQALGPGIS